MNKFLYLKQFITKILPVPEKIGMASLIHFKTHICKLLKAIFPVKHKIPIIWTKNIKYSMDVVSCYW